MSTGNSKNYNTTDDESSIKYEIEQLKNKLNKSSRELEESNLLSKKKDIKH